MGGEFSEGARRLWKAVADIGSATKVAEKAGASPSALARWLYGDRRPGLEWALKLEVAFGIPPRCWQEESKRPFDLPATGTES